MEKEIWKTNNKLPVHYLISNKGNVRLLERVIIDKNGLLFRKKGILLMKTHDIGGYRRITLVVNKKRKNFLIHRLVAETFIPNLENKCCINHINGIRDDNNVENLEWVTVRQNEHHKQKVLKNNHNIGIHKCVDGKYNVVFEGQYIGRRKTLTEAKELYKNTIKYTYK